MTPTVPRTLGEQIYQQLAAKGVNDSAHAVRVLVLHAHRRRLTRAQLVHLLAQFAPRNWDPTTMAAVDRLLVDRGEHPDVAELHAQVGSLWPAAGPWPADGDGDPWAGDHHAVSVYTLVERIRAHWADHISSVILDDPAKRLSVHLDLAQARALGRELLAAADAGDAALAARVAEALAETSGPGDDGDVDRVAGPASGAPTKRQRADVLEDIAQTDESDGDGDLEMTR